MVRKDPETKSSLKIFEFGCFVRRPRSRVPAARDRASSMEGRGVGGNGALLGIEDGVGVCVGILLGSGGGMTQIILTSSSVPC